MPDIAAAQGSRCCASTVAYPGLDLPLSPVDEDTYQVVFATPGGWTVPGTSAIRVAVSLEDWDLVSDDYIGLVTLDEEDLRAAWNEHPDDYHWIQVSDQMQPILFLQVLVRTTP